MLHSIEAKQKSTTVITLRKKRHETTIQKKKRKLAAALVGKRGVTLNQLRSRKQKVPIQLFNFLGYHLVLSPRSYFIPLFTAIQGSSNLLAASEAFIVDVPKAVKVGGMVMVAG